MKRFIFALFLLSFFACDVTNTEQKEETKYSTFIISFVNRDSNLVEGWDSTRAAYIVTKVDSAFTKKIFDKYPFNLTEHSKIPCYYSYTDSMKTGVTPINFDRAVRKFF